MAIYDWQEFADLDLAGRFPRRDYIVGVDLWTRLVSVVRDLAGQAGTPERAVALSRAFDQFVQAVDGLGAPRAPARVFVSHQRNDWGEGRARCLARD